MVSLIKPTQPKDSLRRCRPNYSRNSAPPPHKNHLRPIRGVESARPDLREANGGIQEPHQSHLHTRPHPRLQRHPAVRLPVSRLSAVFLRIIFHIFNYPVKLQPFCSLTPAALQFVHQESEAIQKTLPLAIARLVKLLSMSIPKKLPLRAIFKVWKELGLPDDFEQSIISGNTHTLVLNDSDEFKDCVVPAVQNWRIMKDEFSMDRTELKYSFKLGFPRGCG